MLYWTIKITIISIILIFLVHHLISFFTSTLTVPKIKDILSSSTQKYDLIYNIISKPDLQNQYVPQPNQQTDESYNKSTSIDLLPNTSSDDNMKLELKKFDPSTIKSDSVVVLIGKRNTGKSYCMKDILSYHKDLPVGVLVICLSSWRSTRAARASLAFLHWLI